MNFAGCPICGGTGRVNESDFFTYLFPDQILFGDEIIVCPKCGKDALLSRLAKNWPCEDSTTFDHLERFPQLTNLVAVEKFIDGLPSTRTLALHVEEDLLGRDFLLFIRQLALDAGLSVIYVTGAELKRRIQSCDDYYRSEEWLDLCVVDLLIIDGLDDVQDRPLGTLFGDRCSHSKAIACTFKDEHKIHDRARDFLQAWQDWLPEDSKSGPYGWFDLRKDKGQHGIYNKLIYDEFWRVAKTRTKYA